MLVSNLNRITNTAGHIKSVLHPMWMRFQYIHVKALAGTKALDFDPENQRRAGQDLHRQGAASLLCATLLMFSEEKSKTAMARSMALAKHRRAPLMRRGRPRRKKPSLSLGKTAEENNNNNKRAVHYGRKWVPALILGQGADKGRMAALAGS